MSTAILITASCPAASCRAPAVVFALIWRSYKETLINMMYNYDYMMCANKLNYTRWWYCLLLYYKPEIPLSNCSWESSAEDVSWWNDTTDVFQYKKYLPVSSWLSTSQIGRKDEWMVCFLSFYLFSYFELFFFFFLKACI